MSLKFAILGLLESAPMTGYDLGRRFAASTSWVWAAPQSQIYPLLGRLEAEGLISGEDAVSNGRLRREFRVTPAGSESLREWVRSPQPPAPTRDPLILQALFLDVVDDTTAVALLREAIEAEQERVDARRIHRDQLAVGETQVIRERLRGRSEVDVARITALKAAAFDGLVEEGEARIRWLTRMVDVVESLGSRQPVGAGARPGSD